MRASAPAEITSLQNSWIKEIRKAVRKGGATDSGLLVAEGIHLYEEALRSGLAVEAVLAAPEYQERIPGATRVPAGLMREISSLEQAAGVVALVRAPSAADLQWEAGHRILVLDAVQDPGNAGTLLRSAEAFGVSAVVALKGSVDLFSPKVLRASAGSVFRVPVLRQVEWGEIGVPAGWPVVAAAARGGEDVTAVGWKRGAAIVVGNEGQGVSAEIMVNAMTVTIATRGVESLNAAVAASILLYEAARGADR
jgi:TrmH family RNA methyltransferase